MRGDAMKYTDSRLLEHLASAYVLGTLTGAARRRFERLQCDRVDVRGLVIQWESRLGQLAISLPPQQRSARLWAAIETRTRPASTPSAKAA